MSAGGTFARRWRWLLLVVVVGYFGLDCLYFTVIGGRFILIPDERDPRLVGRWSGPLMRSGLPHQGALTFEADGTWWTDYPRMSRSGPRRSTWGTGDGRLHVKWLATDAWIGKAFPYALSDDGRTLRLKPGRWGNYFPSILRRVGLPAGATPGVKGKRSDVMDEVSP